MPTVKEIRDFLSDKADDAQFEFIVSSIQWVVNDAQRQVQDGETVTDESVSDDEIIGSSPSEVVAEQEEVSSEPAQDVSENVSI